LRLVDILVRQLSGEFSRRTALSALRAMKKKEAKKAANNNDNDNDDNDDDEEEDDDDDEEEEDDDDDDQSSEVEEKIATLAVCLSILINVILIVFSFQPSDELDELPPNSYLDVVPLCNFPQ
jgi:ABC-type Zn2+ transport system substrate-binding protein/surface adhesin